MPMVYAQCAIGLRLTPHDGNANTVQEMEAMNIPVVHNQSEYGLKWKTVDDIIDHILKCTEIFITIDQYHSINIENNYSYTALENNLNGDAINENNFIKNLLKRKQNCIL